MDFKTFRLVLFCLFISGTLSGQPNLLTANQVIGLIKKNVGVPWSGQTVDTFKTGNPEDGVTGITTCMFADMKVLQKAVAEKNQPDYYARTGFL